MRNQIICVVKDTKSDVYMKPYCIQNEFVAERDFRSVITSERRSIISDYPEDFVVYKIGVYDDENGTLIPCEKVVIVKGSCVKYEIEKENKNGTQI